MQMKIILLKYKNNYVLKFKHNEQCYKKLLYSSNQRTNYFHSSTKLFLDVYLVKFLAKPFFLYTIIIKNNRLSAYLIIFAKY